MERYGATWPKDVSDLAVELAAIRFGGRWTHDGVACGRGLAAHVAAAIDLLWPGEHVWEPWSRLLNASYAQAKRVAVLGPASSGKTHFSALFALVHWYAAPLDTVITCSSTTREMLEQRIMGEVWDWHRRAKARWPELMGEPSKGALALTAASEDPGKPRGIFGVACLAGGEFRGLGNYIGVKAPRVMLVADELQLMPRVFLDATANLIQNPDFRFAGMGNPIDETDTLCIAAEPESGWDVVLNMPPKTCVWKTRIGGVAVNLCGLDTPNGNHDPAPYPWLITRGKMAEVSRFWGEESVVYASQALGRLSKAASARRVLTRSMCLTYRATEPPEWVPGLTTTDVVGLDPAYTAVGGGGDRCKLIRVRVGFTLDAHVAAVVDNVTVPIRADNPEPAEEQVAEFCRRYLVEHRVPFTNFGFDSTARGTMALALAKRIGLGVRGIDFGGAAVGRFHINGVRSDEIYGKRVTELWFLLRELVRSGQMRGLDEEIVAELIAREYGPSGRKNIVDVETKDDTRQRIGRSPDAADATAVALDVAFTLRLIVIQSTRTPPMMERPVSREWDRVLNLQKQLLARGNLQRA